MFRTSKILLPALLLVSLSACEQVKESNAEQNSHNSTASLPANHPAINQATQANALGNLAGGVIKEVLSGGGYSYVRVETNGVEMWAAGPQTQVENGQLVGWYNSTLMRNFNSKSLNRTFKEIHFVSQFVDPTKAETVASSPRTGINHQTQAPSGMGGIVENVLTGGGYTYVLVNINGQDVWAAGPVVDVKKGEQVSWSGGSKMFNFTSSTLDKTFDEIYFVAGFNKGVNSQQPQMPTTGLVTQVITSAGYTYIEVNSNSKTLWLAAPEHPVKEQDKISWTDGSAMHNFQSRSLDRVFKEIIFVDGITVI
ncbi:hypothetical protein [Thalassotalea sp. G2M2-11]|uniref:GW dipeptide domain-containing protein n=1 Tax=Thalassotalea sp. G2M2-11 TaxID=2787627 RepID=UPI0019CF5E92|nr:hypothetical protein [Thalassotalea sp. G2M2-11]